MPPPSTSILSRTSDGAGVNVSATNAAADDGTATHSSALSSSDDELSNPYAEDEATERK